MTDFTEIHKTAIVGPDVKLGIDVMIRPFCNLFGCTIGDGTTVGAFCTIGREVRIGKRCKLQDFVVLNDGHVIGDEVFIGSHVTFCNDMDPVACIDHKLVRAGQWKCEPVTVHDGASIGSGVMVAPGVTIGAGAKIGCGSVVVRDVPAGYRMFGNPARPTLEVPR